MLEVCKYISSSTPVMESDEMKHPSNNAERSEFNLGKARELRCKNQEENTTCGQCESCQLNLRLKEVKEWFFRLGDFSKKKFMLGLLRRMHSTDLLKQMVSLLQAVATKDFMYARTRTQPGLETDAMTLSSDRALNEEAVLHYITSSWDWFVQAPYWSKANFVFGLLQMCDAYLLSLLHAQVKMQFVFERKTGDGTSVPLTDHVETASIATTEYSYHSEKNRDLDLLAQARTDCKHVTDDPSTGKAIVRHPVSTALHRLHSDMDGDSVAESENTIDPAAFTVPTSCKAHSGASRHKDFISSLPVHLSKYILSFLDQVSLVNALRVNQKWRTLVEEVHQERFINQSLTEEVMLMQGAAAQAANPVYASDVDVLVPVLYPGTHEVQATEDTIIKTSFKSEISFKTAYSGVVTRKVIMEERNVYCGAYNVMVLTSAQDSHRVVHADGGKMIALGSRDRKVRFIDCDSGRERGPVITGHAGSVRCVCLCEKRGIVFSGSYDTSIRCWSIETGQCLKIYRGHTDTVMTILVQENMLASGARDKSCKVWNIQTGKCEKTFRHRHPVLAVALSTEVCITGCEGGRVMVWELTSGQLIKNLSGHRGPVTTIKFDRWHIITGSEDGYALAWSSLGHHNRCLTALRHPKEVLCLEFMYLRVITGCSDGRVRIWNMLTGQCCRIMRGNSRSDPVQDILAIGDRIFLNTHNNLLLLHFEHIEWDYTLETDKVPPLVQYGSYSDAPIRSQPYAYVRAQRMRKAGASNTKIVHRSVSPPPPPGSRVILQHGYHAQQLPHSAKSLSEHSMEVARRIHSSMSQPDLSRSSCRDGSYFSAGERQLDSSHAVCRDSQHELSAAGSIEKRMSSFPSSSSPATKHRPSTSKSVASVTIVEKSENKDLTSVLLKKPPVIRRRVSWAFDKPLEPQDKTISLSEMKSLLRSQIRMKAESIVPPDFIYLTVNTIQATMVPSETNHNTRKNMLEEKVAVYTQHKRPSSSPSRIDPRTKLPVEELGLKVFMAESETVSEVSELKSIRSAKVKEPPKPSPIANKEEFTTLCSTTQVNATPYLSIHPTHIKSTIPKGRVIRPISAGIPQQKDADFMPSARPVTAPAPKTRPITGKSALSSIRGSLPGSMPVPSCSQQWTSSALECAVVPILMYSKKVTDKIEEMKQQNRKARQVPITVVGDRPVGKFSPHNMPLRNHIKFELKTHKQEQAQLDGIMQANQEQRMMQQLQLERKQRAAWLAKVKGQTAQDFSKKPWSLAPEIGE